MPLLCFVPCRHVWFCIYARLELHGRGAAASARPHAVQSAMVYHHDFIIVEGQCVYRVRSWFGAPGSGQSFLCPWCNTALRCGASLNVVRVSHRHRYRYRYLYVVSIPSVAVSVSHVYPIEVGVGICIPSVLVSVSHRYRMDPSIGICKGIGISSLSPWYRYRYRCRYLYLIVISSVSVSVFHRCLTGIGIWLSAGS